MGALEDGLTKAGAAAIVGGLIMLYDKSDKIFGKKKEITSDKDTTKESDKEQKKE